MPRESTDRRKSSLGTRRGPPRQHIPFRADDLARGKKTGMAVGYVDRNSDEFEPFEQVIKQADNRTPPRIRAAKRKGISIIAPVREEVDEDGEMSMELAESNQGSPLVYFTNAHQAFAPNSTRRLAPSRMFDSFVPPQQDESPLRSFVPNDPDPAPFDDYEPPQRDDTPRRSPSRDPSPSHPGADEEDGDAMEVENAVEDQGDDQGMEEVGEAHDEEEDAPLPKKSRQEDSNPKKPRGRPQKRVVKPPVERSPTPEGLRRGRRIRYRPLEWWRQEKVVYGRRESGLTLVPQIKEIIRIPQEPPRPLGKAGKRKRGASVRAKSKARETQTPFDSEEGWDDDTPTNATVIDFDTKEEVSRRVAFLARMIDPKPAANSNWFFQKIFGEGEFIAAGQMHIPPKGQKPSKSTKDNTYVFYVIQGAVSVFIHETNFIITTGGMFLVPRGNTYYIENIAERDAKLFFTQARMLPADDLALQQHTAQSAPPSSYRRAISDDPSTAPKRGKA